jgi:hypothetical protein
MSRSVPVTASNGNRTVRRDLRPAAPALGNDVRHCALPPRPGSVGGDGAGATDAAVHGGEEGT